MAKVETKAERLTDLQIYANRRPKVSSGKITEDLINQHLREAMKKLEGNKKMKHKMIADDVSAVSFIHSNVIRVLRVRMPVKPKRTLVLAPSQAPSENVTVLGSPKELPLTIVIAEPPSRPKRKAATKATKAFQPIPKLKRSSPSITESDESLASIQTCPPTTSSSSAPSGQIRRQLIKQTQIQNKSIVSRIQKTAAKSQNVESDYTVGPCSPV